MVKVRFTVPVEELLPVTCTARVSFYKNKLKKKLVPEI